MNDSFNEDNEKIENKIVFVFQNCTQCSKTYLKVILE